MSRRYLTKSEIASALRRGKAVEAFLGGFTSGETQAIRWLQINGDGATVIGKIWESPDFGSEDYADIYSFGPLDDNDEYGEPAAIYPEQPISNFYEIINIKFPGVSARLVNEGIVQDEYLDYKRANKDNSPTKSNQ